MVKDSEVNICLFAVRYWILYFQKIQLTEEPVQTGPFTSECCKSVMFVSFQCIIKIKTNSFIYALSRLISVSTHAVSEEEENAFALCQSEVADGDFISEVTCKFCSETFPFSTIPCRTGDHRHGNREAAAGVRLVGSRSSSQLPR